jgi:hypothetical protein
MDSIAISKCIFVLESEKQFFFFLELLENAACGHRKLHIQRPIFNKNKYDFIDPNSIY